MASEAALEPRGRGLGFLLWMALALSSAAIRLWVLAQYASRLRLPFDGDFRGMRLAFSSAAQHGWAWVYDPANFVPVTRAAGIRDFAMLNPPLLTPILEVVGRIPWPAAAWIWLGAGGLLFAAGLYLVSSGWPLSRRLVLALAAFGWFPVFEALGEGNDSAIAFFGVALAYRLARDGRDRPAGLALALGVLKPQILFLLPIAMLAGGRWRLFVWSAVGVVAAGLVSLAVAGPGAFQAWALTLLEGRAHVKVLNAEVDTLVFYLPRALTPFVIAACAGLAAYIARARRGSPEVVTVVFAAGLLASLLAAPYADPQEFSALLIVGWLLWTLGRRAWIGAALGVTYAVLSWTFLLLPSPVPVLEALTLLAWAGATWRLTHPAPALRGAAPAAEPIQA